jgi:hypothetical protein
MQLHAVNARLKRVSQRRFNHMLNKSLRHFKKFNRKIVQNIFDQLNMDEWL